jgi:hypothetical protein
MKVNKSALARFMKNNCLENIGDIEKMPKTEFEEGGIFFHDQKTRSSGAFLNNSTPTDILTILNNLRKKFKD